MTEHSPEEQKKVVNQTNRGSGTFVGGNVIGNIVNLFMPAQRRHPAPDGNRPGIPDDDYADITSPLFASGFLGVTSGAGVFYNTIRGVAIGGGPVPDPLKRWVGGFLFAAIFFACVAVFLARAAQGFELWAGRCADLAVDTRVRVLAYLPASMARITASASSVTATVAAFVALLYGWGEFGRGIQDRAHIARDNAAIHVARARAATRGN